MAQEWKSQQSGFQQQEQGGFQQQGQDWQQPTRQQSDYSRGSDSAEEIFRDLFAEKQGFLWKESKGITKHWKRSWFVLHGHQLTQYESEQRQKALKSLELRDCSIKLTDNVRDGHRVFELSCPTRPFFFYCDTEGERENWIKSILQNINYMDVLKRRVAIKIGELEQANMVQADKIRSLTEQRGGSSFQDSSSYQQPQQQFQQGENMSSQQQQFPLQQQQPQLSEAQQKSGVGIGDQSTTGSQQRMVQ